ncbi:MAG: hypothetical protein CMJ42_11280 [Phyllobacteriaceae bacterium]|nr:hypothetical protein [Phyllobacteriaceae bacterium]MBA89283.1 hypothetical protein [Phyllobacteriaceae bacterium]
MMKKRTPIRFLAAAALGLAAISPAAAWSLPRPAPGPSIHVMPVAGGCYAVGQRVAAQKGGQLAKASQETRGGRSVCVIVVLVPRGGGQRPSRQEVVVPYQ